MCMCACHGFEQGHVQRDVTANPKRLPFNTVSLGTPASLRRTVRLSMAGHIAWLRLIMLLTSERCEVFTAAEALASSPLSRRP
jgi:hypothetical protein